VSALPGRPSRKANKAGSTLLLCNLHTGHATASATHTASPHTSHAAASVTHLPEPYTSHAAAGVFFMTNYPLGKAAAKILPTARLP
jgi:hypothetical protein